MKLSNMKITVQLVLIVGFLTLLVSGSLTGLMIYELSAVQKSGEIGMDSLNTQQTKSLSTMVDELQKNIDATVTSSNEMVVNLSRVQLRDISASIVGKVQCDFESALSTARALANAIEGYKVDDDIKNIHRNTLIKIVSRMMIVNKDKVVGLWFGFEPNAFDGNDADFKDQVARGSDATGRFVPYFQVKDGKVVIEPLIDPDTTDYYKIPKETNADYITDPYLYNGQTMISLAVPILYDGKVIGVAGVDVTTHILDETLNRYKPYTDGYVYLVSNTGKFVWHPRADLIGKLLNELPGRAPLAESIAKGEGNALLLPDIKDPEDKEKEVFQSLLPIVFSRMESKPWGIVVSAKRVNVMADALMIEKNLDGLKAKCNEQAELMNKTMDQVDSEQNKAFDAAGSKAVKLGSVAAVVVVVMVMVLVVFVGRSFAGPIARTVKVLKKLTDEGDLSVEVDPLSLQRLDEIGDLERATKQLLADYHSVSTLAQELAGGNWTISVRDKGEKDEMNHHLKRMLTLVCETLHEINDNVNQVSVGAGEVSSAAQSLSNGAQQSAASMEEITASMQEISGQTKQNAQGAADARDLAQKASEAALKGQEAMKKMTDSMERITKNSSEVQRVIKVIDDIAFQTNLLALNAAVEAARAGQHGKGFAVVAEEVRNLAARSAKAARETSELIATSGHEIKAGGEVASNTGGVLNTIVDQVKKTTDLIAGIAVASNEQAEGVGQISIGLAQIDSVTQQNTAAAEQSASAASEMSGQAAKLQKLVSKFRI